MTTIHIPDYGDCPAVEVQDLKPGTVTIWTGGHKEAIAGVEHSASGKTHRIRYASGKIDHRSMRTGRLVAVQL